jgi:hypothetical protein
MPAGRQVCHSVAETCFSVHSRFYLQVKGRSKPIPDDMTIDQASEFWDTHSAAEYPSHIVQLQYSPTEHLTFVAIAGNLIPLLE